MIDPLEEFSRADADLIATREGFTDYKECWYSWNYWAQHHSLFSFDEWMREHKLKFHQIKAKHNYPEADVLYIRSEGYRYYSEWRGAQYALDAAEEKFDTIFQELWEAVDDHGEPLYSNAELGAPLGKNAEQLRKFATKRSWHYPRTMKGKKMSNEQAMSDTELLNRINYAKHYGEPIRESLLLEAKSRGLIADEIEETA